MAPIFDKTEETSQWKRRELETADSGNPVLDYCSSHEGESSACIIVVKRYWPPLA
jgi:hypothetical protein